MTVPETLAELDRTIAQAAPEELPALVGRLVELEERARLRLRGEALGNGHRPKLEAPDVWITPEQAAEIAGVSKDRIYAWAQGQKWASRPTRRCLRIEEEGLRRWLASRTR